MHYPKNLRATATSSYILSLCGGLSNRRLFVRRPTDERRFKKVTCIRSAFSINSTTRKISIRKANKIQRRSRIPNSKFKKLFKIPEDLLNCLTMRSAWRSLKACTQAYNELDVRSCHREVQEGADHAPVLPLIDHLTIFIGIQCCHHTHWG
jgi:hypothetical protein